MSVIDTPRPIPVSWRETLDDLPHFPMILLAIAGHMTLFGMLTPVMALYAKSFGAPEWQIGLMITIFAAGRLVADLPAGFLAPRIGLRPLFVAGMAMCALGAVIGALAPTYPLVLAGRTIQGLGSGLFMTSAMIYCATHSRPGSRGKVMSMFQGATLVGGAFGPSIGGLAAAAFGMSGPFWVAAGVCLVTGILPLLFFQETRGTEGSRSAHGGGLRLLLAVPFLAVLMVNFGFFLTRTAGQWQMIPLLANERFGIGPQQMGLAISLSAIATLCILPLASWLVDRVARWPVVAMSLLATGLALLAIVLADSPMVLYAAMIFMGVSTGIGGPALAAHAVDLAPEGRHGPAMGILRFAGDLGYLVGPLSIGALVGATGIGHGGGISVNAALLLVTAVVFVAFARPPPTPQPLSKGEPQ